METYISAPSFPSHSVAENNEPKKRFYGTERLIPTAADIHSIIIFICRSLLYAG